MSFGAVNNYGASNIGEAMQSSTVTESREVYSYMGPGAVTAHAEIGKVTTKEVTVESIGSSVATPSVGTIGGSTMVSSKVSMSNEDFPKVSATFKSYS